MWSLKKLSASRLGALGVGFTSALLAGCAAPADEGGTRSAAEVGETIYRQYCFFLPFFRYQ